VTELTTHVLDTAAGRPAAGVPVTLEAQDRDGAWRELATARTDDDGRSPSLHCRQPGLYRLRFDVIAHHGPDAFFPEVSITFRVGEGEAHLHVPLLLAPFGYSTYRGS
jgi:5-hydroxyisourate hydrolase